MAASVATAGFRATLAHVVAFAGDAAGFLRFAQRTRLDGVAVIAAHTLTEVVDAIRRRAVAAGVATVLRLLARVLHGVVDFGALELEVCGVGNLFESRSIAI